MTTDKRILYRAEMRFDRARDLFCPQSPTQVIAAPAIPFVSRHEWHRVNLLGEDVFVERIGDSILVHQREDHTLVASEDAALAEARKRASKYNNDQAKLCQAFANAYAKAAIDYHNA